MIAVSYLTKFFDQLRDDLSVTGIVIYVGKIEITLENLLAAIKKLPADNTEHDQVIVFTEYTETKFFKPEEVNMDMITFVWNKDGWYLKNIM